MSSPESTTPEGIQIAIDRGGTFCDIIARIPSRPDYVFKLLSVDPLNYSDAPTEGIRRVLEYAHGTKIPRGEKLDLHSIDSIRMGTTVATNALLERKGEPVLLVTTQGFGDVLVIGNQTRPHIFDLTARKLARLYTDVLEIDERVTIETFSEGRGSVASQSEKHAPANADESSVDSLNIVKAPSGDIVRIIKAPDYQHVTHQLQQIYDDGRLRSIALCLLHSYTFSEHESKIAEIARKIGFDVSVSHQLQPMIGFVNRCSSTVADAYLLPIIKSYIDAFAEGFKGGLPAFGNKLLFMQSNGGLCPWYAFSGLRAILSGPAGGMVGYGATCHQQNSLKATIGFDAGGTSTDVSRYSGSLNHIFETVVSQVSLQIPQLDISTVAAGGGLMLFHRNGMFVVGPESAGSDPGPTCYRKGGPLTVTDANLYLGRLVPSHFPSIFGPNMDEPLDIEATTNKFVELTAEINKDSTGPALSTEQVALGFLKVAVEAMARPIRNMTEAKGHLTSNHNLASFGGSGGQFATSLARNLCIENVLIHKYSSLLLAYGILLADIVIEKQAPVSLVYLAQTALTIDAHISELTTAAYDAYTNQDLTGFPAHIEVLLNLKYQGLDTRLLIPTKHGAHDADERFVEKHLADYGFTLDRAVLVDDVRVMLIAESAKDVSCDPYTEYDQLTDTFALEESDKVQLAYFDQDGWIETPLFNLTHLPKNAKIVGPAIIIDETQTIVVEPGSSATILQSHIFVRLDQDQATEQLSDTLADPIQLAVFGHRFMSIAEQMGHTLQQTAISTNIKERLDFSCALFDANGDLVANAPHIPIHLGAMSFAVKAQMEIWEGNLDHGDVLVSNHPVAGGLHLPDITVITPILDDEKQVLFWTASRGHHADIGLISAGLMPPQSKTIFDEGAAIITHKLCVRGEFDEPGMTRLLFDEPAKYPGGSGTRALLDNISDLKAQVLANHKGVVLLQRLISEFGLSVIYLYMRAIQDTAEELVRGLLARVYDQFDGKPLHAIDYLDDGTPIALKVEIDATSRLATFDFTECGTQVYGNLNAPRAILYLAVLYVLRTLILSELPLNNGCLAPIEFLTREGSVVHPSAEAAVVGGNVETTQRVVDVMLQAFKAAAASQGTCNNLTFGVNDKEQGISFGYYETICGGLGAGPTWNGQLTVQCHTTNTRMTDVEVFEKRYPVILWQFSVRKGSGGNGKNRGGDGVVREIEFTLDGLQVLCLMERRALAPPGLCGGEDGARGRNSWVKENETTKGLYLSINLGGKCTVTVKKGERIIIETPGGGGYGSIGNNKGATDLETELAIPIPTSSPLILTGSVGMRSIVQETN